MHILYTFNFIIPPFVQPAPQIIVVDYVYWLKAAKDSTQERTRGKKSRSAKFGESVKDGPLAGSPEESYIKMRMYKCYHMLSYVIIFICACMYIYVCIPKQLKKWPSVWGQQ